MRYVSVLVLGVLALGAILTACSPGSSGDASKRLRLDTLAYYADGPPKSVAVREGDSVIERRTYRRTGTLRRVASTGSTRTYFDLHDPDSAAVLQDYLHGRWRNLSADPTREQASAFYIFGSARLRFETPSRVPIETLSVTYEDNRTLTAGAGLSVRPKIISFDTVRVTGYTLVRLPPSDSL